MWNAYRTWIEPRQRQNGQDWYLFTYNRDYHKVLSEYAALCGPIPMIPRYTLGPWITDFNFEYFPGTLESQHPEFKRYDQQYLKDEVSRLRQNLIPFDTLVLDFAWHNYGWQGGYDWSPLIPHPDELVSWLHGQGVKLSLNDHPGYANTDESILSFSDSHAPQVLRALGRPLPPRPSFDMDISKLWSFSTDPHDQGLRITGSRRVTTTGTGSRSASGCPGKTEATRAIGALRWYRASVRLPAKAPRGACICTWAEVNKTYRIFVNGTEATAQPGSLAETIDLYRHCSLRHGWPPERRIVLRVEPGEPGEGGILRGPVAIRDVKPPQRSLLRPVKPRAGQDSLMRDLHQPLMQQGVDLWWVDGGGGAVDMPGLNKQLWTNKVFYDYTQHETGQRGFILSRYGDWGSERYPAFFTGDAYSQWPVLAYEVAFAVRGGNVLIPYISHDIGGFHGGKIDFELYARWLEFGTFSPFLRMHSAHANPREGNVRMPWVYGSQGIALMRGNTSLCARNCIPYLYTYTWRAHTRSRCRSCVLCTCNIRIWKRPTSTRTNISSARKCWSLPCLMQAAIGPCICRLASGWISLPASATRVAPPLLHTMPWMKCRCSFAKGRSSRSRA